MNKYKAFILGLVILLVCIFFPYSITKVLSGNGEIQTLDSERVGDCVLVVEISELRSLFFCYDKSFSYTVDGKEYNTFRTSSYSKADNLNVIHRLYYDAILDQMASCSLQFPDDFSYAVIKTDTNKYYLRIESKS